MRVAVVVLGDVARSPRTLYHALAVAAKDVDVDLVGYVESELPSSISNESKIVVHPVRGGSPPAAAERSRLWYLANAAWRGLATATKLTSLLLWRLPRPDVILVQNPPGVPVLLVAWMACRARRARFLIDWHNLTHSMLALRLGPRHWIVRLVCRYEGALGQRADAHLFVSGAMQQALGALWGLSGIVFRDRPAEAFEPMPDAERARIRQELRRRLAVPRTGSAFAMAISPTSWTADEDFGLLLEAITMCEALIREREDAERPFPDLLILLTGRGPLRPHYEEQMATRASGRIHVRTIWLEAAEYPRVLAAADLGLCLHRSASGIDLPMKVADMFGAGIPVCALNYGQCLSEIVQHGTNGLLFSSSGELARQMYDLFQAFPLESSALAALRGGVTAAPRERWQSAWNAHVWPLLQTLQGRE